MFLSITQLSIIRFSSSFVSGSLFIAHIVVVVVVVVVEGCAQQIVFVGWLLCHAVQLVQFVPSLCLGITEPYPFPAISDRRYAISVPLLWYISPVASEVYGLI